MSEFSEFQPVCLVSVPVIHASSKIPFQPLIQMFRLAISLGVISCGESRFNLEGLVECPKELGIVLRPPVCNCVLGGAMELPNMQ
jgi:hypothetical protein